MTVIITTNTPFGGRETEKVFNVRDMYTEDACLWLEAGSCEMDLHIISIPVIVIENVTVDVA